MTAELPDADRYRQLARLCRSDAARSSSAEAMELLLLKAAEYDRKAEALGGGGSDTAMPRP